MCKKTFFLISLLLVLGLTAGTGYAARIPIPAGFPNADTTGIKGAGLTEADLTSSGGIVVTTNGTIVELKNISGGVEIKADNVTIRKCKITGGIYVVDCTDQRPGALIEDCTIVGGSSKTVCGGNMTVRRCDISDASDGIYHYSNTTIEDCWIHDLHVTATSHNDGIQCQNGSNLVVRHNSIQAQYRNQTSAILYHTNFGPVDDVLIENNFLSGGAYTLYLTDKGTGYGPPTNVTVKDNVFEYESYAFGYLNYDGSHTFLCNIWHTGGPIPKNPACDSNDTDPPSPDPMTWATDPYATGDSSISMTATTATDTSGVQYYFDCTTSGGHDSGWQDSSTYEDTGLSASTQYTYKVKARDKSTNQNETAYSTTKSATTDAADTTAPGPDPMTWATEPYATGSTSISMTATTATDASGVEYYFDCTTSGGHDSGWQESSTYEDTGLSASTQYTYKVKARDKSTNQNETAYSTTKSATTDAADTTAPGPDPMTWATEPNATGTSSISMTATTATDESGVEYYFDETSANPGGTDSGWQDSTTYQDTGLDPNTQYTYKVKARDKSANQNETGYSTSKSATTDAESAADIEFDAVSSNSSNVNGTTLSWSHTIGSGDNRILIVGISGEDSSSSDLNISSVKYNNVSMSLVTGSSATEGTSTLIKTELYYLLEADLPSSGAYTATITYSGSVSSRTGGAISLVNVKQQTAEAVATNTVTSQAAISTNITTLTDGAWVVDAVGCGNPGAGYTTTTSGMVERYDESSGYSSGAGSTKDVTTAGSTTMSWEYGGTGNRQVHSVAAFAPASQAPPDTTAPTPDPMTWATEPYTTGTSSISMTATTATDASGVEYYFECTAGGGHSSSWQDSTTYEDTGLSASTQYTYRVKARDKSANLNETGYSTSESATTDAAPDTTPPSPNPMTWATVPYATGVSSISMTATTATDASGVEYYFDCTAGGGNDSGWQDSTTYEDTGLDDLTQYTYRVKARDKSSNQNETAYSTSQSATTEDGTAPSPDPMTWATVPYNTGTSSISMTATTATDASGVEYYFDCTTTGGHDSGWQASATYEDTGLDDLTQYTYRVKARDGSSNLNETAYSTSQSATTQDGTAPSPNPMTWATVPYATGTTSISMTATTATDAGGAEYYFDCTAGGGHDSAWQDSTTYEDTGLSASTQYTYQVKARDKSTNYNETAYSTSESATTDSEAEPGLTGWWKLDETSGTTAADSSGNSYDGTVTGATWDSSGYIDGALSFDGTTTNRCEIPGSALSASAGTVTLWGKVSSTTNVRYFFGHTSNPDGWSDRIQLYMSSGDSQLDLGLGDSHTKSTNIMTLSTNTWYHIALTWNGSNYVVYVDGLSKASGTYTGLSTLGSIADIGNNGGRGSTPDEALAGLIDDVCIYDEALSKYDIADLAGITIASDPSPADEATDVAITADLSWSAGQYAASHDVYMGTDYNSVADANHSSAEFKGNQGSTTYDPGTMDASTTYYWAIDEVNDSNTLAGDVWSFTTTGADTDPPTPDPMTWATEPYATGTTSISMTATTATDASGVEYYFDCTTTGGSDSGWQDSASYEDTGLSASTQYTYQVKARDKSANQNETGYSTAKSATTDAPPDTDPPSPDPMTWATEPYATGTTSISMTATTATDASGVEYYFDCTTTGGHDSGWQDSASYEDTGLSASTQYTYQVKARDKSANQNETGYSTAKSATTDATGGQSLEFTASEDTYVNEQAPNNNHGSESTLRIRTSSSGKCYYSYIKVTVSGANGTVTSAKLKIRAYEDIPFNVSAWAVTGSWSENTLTWNNDNLSWGGSALDTKSYLSADTWYEWDVTTAVSGNGTYTFGIKSSGTSSMKLYSTESAYDPQLLVETNGGE